MVVVLPTPFTPTVSSTKGRALRSITSGCATGASIATSSARRAASRAWASANSRAFMRLRRPSTRTVVAATPTSAVSRAVSISSSRSSSSLGLRENRPPKLRAKVLLRRRSRQPGLPGAAAGSVPGVVSAAAASPAAPAVGVPMAAAWVAASAGAAAVAVASTCSVAPAGGPSSAGTGPALAGTCGKAAASSSALKRLSAGAGGASCGFLRRKKLTIACGCRRMRAMLAPCPTASR